MRSSLRRLAIAATLLGNAAGVAAPAFELITEAEASRHEHPATEIEQMGMGRPPRITVSGDGNTTSPLSLDIEVQAFHGAEVNRDTMRLIYLKRPPVNLLPRVEQFVEQRPHGVVIKVRDAEVPVGRHRLVLRVEDSDEKWSEKLFELVVHPE